MKRKLVFLVGYKGNGYSGLQWNKEANTIEKAIIDVLLDNKLIKEINSKDASKIDLKSSSRTDKGVHATFNVISAKIEQELTDDLFLKLKEDFSKHRIHLHKILKVPRSFIPHKSARSRVYKYIVPTYFLKESNFNEEYLKRIEDDRSNREEIAAELSGQSSSDSQQEESSEKATHKIEREYKMEDIEDVYGYKASNIDLFRKLMQEYVGSKSYHNFTLKSNINGLSRFIKTVSVSEPFINNDVEYVEVLIHGQSFLLHQIRKMISFAVLNCRYCTEEQALDNFKRVFTEEIHVPKAPSQYLYLNNVFFDDFNINHDFNIEIDPETNRQYEINEIIPEILKEENLLEWLKYLDAVKFHHERFSIFKK